MACADKTVQNPGRRINGVRRAVNNVLERYPCERLTARSVRTCGRPLKQRDPRPVTPVSFSFGPFPSLPISLVNPFFLFFFQSHLRRCWFSLLYIERTYVDTKYANKYGNTVMIYEHHCIKR